MENVYVPFGDIALGFVLSEDCYSGTNEFCDSYYASDGMYKSIQAFVATADDHDMVIVRDGDMVEQYDIASHYPGWGFDHRLVTGRQLKATCRRLETISYVLRETAVRSGFELDWRAYDRCKRLLAFAASGQRLH